MFSILGFSRTNIRNRLQLSGSKKWGWLHKEYFLSLFLDDKVRRRRANEPWNVATYLVRRYTGATLESIGREFNPDIAVEGKIGLQKKRKANKNAPFR